MGRLKNDTVVRTLLFCDTAHLPDEQWNVDDPQDRLIDVRRGELWRIITPIFVHYGPMHLAFNMIMFYQLGSLVEDRRGTWRIGLMIVVIAACSNTVQALVPMRIGGSPFAAGMSGVLYGLFGYIWMKSIFAPELGLAVSRSTVIVLMVWLFLGIAGALDTETASVANWTHGVGFLAGVAIGYGPELLRPFRTG
jgi:GlpG protein